MEQIRTNFQRELNAKDATDFVIAGEWHRVVRGQEAGNAQPLRNCAV
jgi:hypothetical protein